MVFVGANHASGRIRPCHLLADLHHYSFDIDVAANTIKSAKETSLPSAWAPLKSFSTALYGETSP